MHRWVVGVLVSSLLAGCASGPPVSPKAAPTTVAATPEKGPAVAAAPGGTETPTAPRNGPWIGAAGASDFVLAGTRDTFMGVWVDVPTATKRQHVPMSLGLVIDTSGSMAGPKIVHARASAKALVEGMSDGDIVAITTFSDNAEARVAPTVLDGHSRRRILSAISELGAQGGTNMFEGLRLAEQQVIGSPATHPIRRVIMISDGLATVGATSPEILGALAARGAEHGVQVSSIGVGLEYDENTLNALAVRSSGRLWHIADSNALAKMVEGEIKLLDQTMATGAIVEIIPAPGVRVLGADGVRADWNGTSLRVPLGTMFGGQHREMLVRLRVTAADSGGQRALASVRLHFRDPSDDNLDRVQEVVARYTVTGDAAVVAKHANDKAGAIAAVSEAAQVAVRAAQQVNADQFEDADRELARVEQRVMDEAKKAKDKGEQARLTSEAQRMSKARKSVQAAAAAPPASKPAAKRASSLDVNESGMKAAGF